MDDLQNAPKPDGAPEQVDSIIKIRGLRTAFGPHVIHNNLDLDVHRGEILGIVGGSGTGKSVLLKTIVGLNKQIEGSIEINGLTRRTCRAKKSVCRARTGVSCSRTALYSVP